VGLRPLACHADELCAEPRRTTEGFESSIADAVYMNLPSDPPQDPFSPSACGKRPVDWRRRGAGRGPLTTRRMNGGTVLNWMASREQADDDEAVDED